MPRLDDLARGNLSFTHFFTLQRKTNRGVYALLCGDLPNLAGGLPKMSAYPEDGRAHLPAADPARRGVPDRLRPGRPAGLHAQGPVHAAGGLRARARAGVVRRILRAQRVGRGRSRVLRAQHRDGRRTRGRRRPVVPRRCSTSGRTTPTSFPTASGPTSRRASSAPCRIWIGPSASSSNACARWVCSTTRSSSSLRTSPWGFRASSSTP